MGALIDPEKIIPEGPAYLGPESLENIHHVINEAGRLGLEMGISGASSWNFLKHTAIPTKKPGLSKETRLVKMMP